MEGFAIGLASPAETLQSVVMWAGIAFAALVGVSVFLAFVRTFLIVCRPNEMLVVSGKKRKSEDGRTIGFMTYFGGRVLRIPVLQKVDYMDTTVMPIAIETRNAYSKGGIPLDVQAIAMVKLSTDRRVVGNAVERFLGKPKGYVQQVARETLEGHLRGVLATLTPEEVNEDRLKFAAKLADEAEADFAKLGLHLDTLKLQHISDQTNYLASLGREQIANILRDAEVAESNAQATADQAAAQADAAGRVAQEKAQQAIIRKQNELRAFKAELDSRTQAELERAQAAAAEAYAKAEQNLQAIRARLEKIRLESDVEIPAEAKRLASELLAAGKAAKIAEEGRAHAEILTAMKEVWQKAGPHASEIFLLRQLDDVLDPIIEAVQQVQVKDSSVVDGGDGRNFAALVASRPTAVLEVLRRLGELTGLDLAGTLVRGPVPTPPGGGLPAVPGAAPAGRMIAKEGGAS